MGGDAGEDASACLKLNLWRISALDPGSFNGRTEDFESSNPGSNPGPGAIKPFRIRSYVLISAEFILVKLPLKSCLIRARCREVLIWMWYEMWYH